jgi:hypothetical protein
MCKIEIFCGYTENKLEIKPHDFFFLNFRFLKTQVRERRTNLQYFLFRKKQNFFIIFSHKMLLDKVEAIGPLSHPSKELR